MGKGKAAKPINHKKQEQKRKKRAAKGRYCGVQEVTNSSGKREFLASATDPGTNKAWQCGSYGTAAAAARAADQGCLVLGLHASLNFGRKAHTKADLAQMRKFLEDQQQQQAPRDRKAAKLAAGFSSGGGSSQHGHKRPRELPDRSHAARTAPLCEPQPQDAPVVLQARGPSKLREASQTATTAAEAAAAAAAGPPSKRRKLHEASQAATTAAAAAAAAAGPPNKRRKLHEASQAATTAAAAAGGAKHTIMLLADDGAAATPPDALAALVLRTSAPVQVGSSDSSALLLQQLRSAIAAHQAAKRQVAAAVTALEVSEAQLQAVATAAGLA